MKQLIITALVCLLVGCGGGSGGTESVASTAGQVTTNIPPNSAGHFIIEMYGDSTMVGFDIAFNGQAPQNIPNTVQSVLSGRGFNVTVTNEGVGGKTLRNLIEGDDGKHTVWIRQMENSPADIVAINFGINDSYAPIGYGPDFYRHLIGDYILIAKSFGKVPVLITPNPTCNPQYQVTPYAEQMRLLAPAYQVPLVDINTYVQSLSSWQSYFIDCIHPSNALYYLEGLQVAEELGKVIVELQKKPG